MDAAENHLKMAIQYAMVGNYIDFGALENVNECELKRKIRRSCKYTDPIL